MRLLLFLLETKIAGMTEFLAIDYARVAAARAVLVVIYCGIQRLGLLQALAAYRGC